MNESEEMSVLMDEITRLQKENDRLRADYRTLLAKVFQIKKRDNTIYFNHKQDGDERE